jgi:mRNA interferase RelE/StbE
MWKVRFSPEAEKDLIKIDNSLKKQIYAGIRKVSSNPLPQSEGG